MLKSQHNVTQTLNRSVVDDSIQEEIDGIAQELEEAMPDDVIDSIITGANLGDKLPTGGLPLLQQRMLEWCQ